MLSLHCEHRASVPRRIRERSGSRPAPGLSLKHLSRPSGDIHNTTQHPFRVAAFALGSINTTAQTALGLAHPALARFWRCLRFWCSGPLIAPDTLCMSSFGMSMYRRVAPTRVQTQSLPTLVAACLLLSEQHVGDTINFCCSQFGQFGLFFHVARSVLSSFPLFTSTSGDRR